MEETEAFKPLLTSLGELQIATTTRKFKLASFEDVPLASQIKSGHKRTSTCTPNAREGAVGSFASENTSVARIVQYDR